MRKSNYSFLEIIYNIKCSILTAISYRGARLIRTPVTIRGKKYIDFGNKLTIGKNCQFEVNGDHNNKCLIFGNNVNIGNNVRIQCAGKIEIGNNVLMGSRITIVDNSHGTYSGEEQDNPITPPNARKLKTSPIRIGDNVWIGDGSIIQKGVTIGKGSVIAANSVITKDVPSNVIVGNGGGVTKILKIYDDRALIWRDV